MDKDLAKGDDAPNYEGVLLKFTNVVKGFQNRWFAINNRLGTLDYYEKEEHKRTSKPRGHISLIFAEIIPSVEDSNSFIINSKSGSYFKLKAANTKERQEWTNNLRRSILYFNKKFEDGLFKMDGSFRLKHECDPRASVIYSNSSLMPLDNGSTMHSSQTSFQYHRDEMNNDLMSTLKQNSRTLNHSRDHVGLEEFEFNREPFKNVSILINQMDELFVSLSKDIESLPTTGSELTFCDKNLLLTKATSSAAIDSLKKCVTLLKHQKIACWKLFNRQKNKELISNINPIKTGHSKEDRSIANTPVNSGSVSSLPAVFGNGNATKNPLNSSIDKNRVNGDKVIIQTLNSAQSHDELTSTTKTSMLSERMDPTGLMSVSPSSLLLPIDDMEVSATCPIDLTESIVDSVLYNNNNQHHHKIGPYKDPTSVGDNQSDDANVMVIDEKHKSIIQHLISQVKLGMDLTKVTLPTFILEKRSLLEMFADFMAHPHLFLKITQEDTPEKRMKALVIWYLTSFHSGKKTSVAKKPYNPIIGETFHCMWHVPCSTPHNQQSVDDEKGEGGQQQQGRDECHHVLYTAEQVSHHPPITAFHVDCPQSAMSMSASIHTRSKFHGMSVTAHMLGTITLRLQQHNEVYQFTLPNAHARNLLSVPKLELGDKVTINCPTTKYSASIVFHTKHDNNQPDNDDSEEPMFGNSSANKISGEIKDPDNKIFIKISGDWNSLLDFQDIRTDESSIIQISDLPIYPKYVNKIEHQKNHESRKLWYLVTEALSKGDIDLATKYKSELEVRQRQSEKSRLARKLPFPVKYFHNTSSNYNETVNNWVFKHDTVSYKIPTCSIP